MTNKKHEALIFANDRPSEIGDDLYQWASDAEDMIRRLHARIVELEKENSYLNDACAELEAHIVATRPTQQGLDAQIIQALSAGMSIEQWQSSVDIRIGSSDLLGRAIANGEETRIELIRRAVSEALAAQAKQG